MIPKKTGTSNQSKLKISIGAVIIIAILIFITAPYVNATGINILSALGLSLVMSVAVIIGLLVEDKLDDYIRWGSIGEAVIVILIALILVSLIADSVVTLTIAMKTLLIFITYSAAGLSKLVSKIFVN